MATIEPGTCDDCKHGKKDIVGHGSPCRACMDAGCFEFWEPEPKPASDAALGAFLAGGVAGALLAYAMGAKLPRQRRRRPYGRFRAAASSAYESSRWARRIPQGGWKASKAS
jgi:hypothetical protein